MKIYPSVGLLLTLILIAQPNNLPAATDSNFSSEDRSLTPESIGRRLRELLDRLKENFTFEISTEDRAPISLMLRNRERLGLTADQVKHLEQIRNDFAKESIRSEANLRIAELDLTSLLEAQPVDMPRVEAKIRDIVQDRLESGQRQLSDAMDAVDEAIAEAARRAEANAGSQPSEPTVEEHALRWMKLDADASAWDILGIEPGASKAEIRAGYRKVALKYHPDKNPDNPLAKVAFNLSKNAYDELIG